MEEVTVCLIYCEQNIQQTVVHAVLQFILHISAAMNESSLAPLILFRI